MGYPACDSPLLVEMCFIPTHTFPSPAGCSYLSTHTCPSACTHRLSPALGGTRLQSPPLVACLLLVWPEGTPFPDPHKSTVWAPELHRAYRDPQNLTTWDRCWLFHWFPSLSVLFILCSCGELVPLIPSLLELFCLSYFWLVALLRPDLFMLLGPDLTLCRACPSPSPFGRCGSCKQPTLTEQLFCSRLLHTTTGGDATANITFLVPPRHCGEWRRWRGSAQFCGNCPRPREMYGKTISSLF